MQWVFGIDEAGYGPNLGPLVQAAVGLRLPAADPGGWETLPVRRCADDADDRLLVDDSKRVMTTPDGTAALGRGAFAAAGLTGPAAFGELLNAIDAGESLRSEVWFDPAEILPGGSVNLNAVAAAVVTGATAFNAAVAGGKSKATLLSRGLAVLVRGVLAKLPPGPEPVRFVCDKHGGRNFYGAMLQDCHPESWIVADVESAAESRYRVLHTDGGFGRDVCYTFRPRADGDSAPVALASMLCKCVREVAMGQFNRYWAARVPGLVPTAGYPGDARRFLTQIHAAMEAAGLPEDAVWRCK